MAYTPKVEERRRGTGALATDRSKVTIRLATFAVGPDGAIASPQPVREEPAVFDFPFIRSIRETAKNTTNQFLADAIVPLDGEAMRVGGLRRVSIECRHQLFDIEVVDVTASTTPVALPVRPPEGDTSPCMANQGDKGRLQEGNSGVSPGNYRALLSELKALEARRSHLATLVPYGTSKSGCPLMLLRLALDVAASSSPRRPAVLITGALHGNEYLGIEKELVTAFLEQPLYGVDLFLSSGGVIYFVPVANPDGFDAGWRWNAEERKDLNRDFDVIDGSRVQRRFEQPESKALADYVAKDLERSGLQLELSIDYHCCATAMIKPWSHKRAPPDARDRADFERLEATFLQIFGRFEFKTGTFHELFEREPTTSAAGSTIDYYYAKYRTRAVAIEGAKGGEKQRLQEHITFLDFTLKSLIERHLGVRR